MNPRFLRNMPSQLKVVTLGLILISGCGSQPENLQLRSTTAKEILKVAQSLRGQEAVLINVWATWCVPCVEEFPVIVELSQRYRSSGLKVYFVAVDFPEEKTKVIDFLTNQGVTGLAFLKEENDQSFINGIHKEWSGAVPFTVVYGKNSGTVVTFWEGAAKKERFETAIQKAIEP